MPLSPLRFALPRALSPKRALALPCAVLLALGLSACAKSVSTSGLKGDAKAAAETIKNLQTDVTAGDEKEICEHDLAKALVSKLAASGGSCEKAIKGQLTQAQRLGAATVVIAHERGFTVRKRGEQDVEAAGVDELAL